MMFEGKLVCMKHCLDSYFTSVLPHKCQYIHNEARVRKVNVSLT